MITLLLGENSFEIDRKIAGLKANFQGQIENYDGNSITNEKLADILTGFSLFAENKLVVIRDLSENKPIWANFSNWIKRISDDVDLVLIERKVDKRSATYKDLKKSANVMEFNPWTERDNGLAEKWVSAEADRQGLKLSKKTVVFLVNWVGVDQWSLYHAIEKLCLAEGEITEETIRDLIEPNETENVFNLFEKSISGKTSEIKKAVDILKLSQDPYMLAGLLSTQAFQLLAICEAGADDNPASDFAIHPFVVSKLTGLAKKLGKAKTRQIVKIFIKLDDSLKTSSIEPWLAIETSLLKLAIL